MSLIIVNPSICAYTRKPFTASNTMVVLKCGCALGSQTVNKNVNDNGFVYCPVCEFAYTVKSKADLMAPDQQLVEEHNQAQLKRCAWYEKEVEAVRQRLDVMEIEDAPAMGELEAAMSFLQLEDDSEVADSSEDDLDDFTAFEATTYAIVQRRLQKLKAKRDALKVRHEDVMQRAKKQNLPWGSDPTWEPEADTDHAAKMQLARKRRKERATARAARFAAREAQRGAKKIVHNINVLNQQAPRKWVKDNPNAVKPADWEEKERAKQGWLTADEQENLDDDEQEKLTNERRAAWKATQSKVPKLFGSVARQRWAERLYNLARQRHYISEKIVKLKDEAGQANEIKLWTLRRDMFEARVLQTQSFIDQRVEKLRKRDTAKAAELAKYFEEATRIGIEEIEAEIAARIKAEEEAKKKAEQEAADAAKAEAKAKAKAEAEARGEEWVDPDGEGDEDEE